MDGIDSPPFMRRVLTNRINTLLDASYIVPRRIGKVSLRIPRARPRGEQIYFIGATNVPLDRLDPALTRPGRMGRHVSFRTPTKEDRKDVFDLYLGKVAHDPELDDAEAARRDRTHHERLLARDDRPGLLDGAHECAARGQGRVRVGAPRPGDDDDRVGHRGQRLVLRARAALASRSTRPVTRSPRTSTGPTSSRAASRSACAAARSAITRPSSARSGSAAGSTRRSATLIHDARRDGGRERLLRREHGRRRRRPAEPRRTRPRGWSARPACGRCASTSNGGVPEGEDEDEAREQIMKRFERIGLHADEPDARQRRLPRRPDRVDPRRPFKRAARRADPRPGVRHRREPVVRNKDAVDEIADTAGREARALRRRAGRAARQAAARRSPRSTTRRTRHGRRCSPGSPAAAVSPASRRRARAIRATTSASASPTRCSPRSRRRQSLRWSSSLTRPGARESGELVEVRADRLADFARRARSRRRSPPSTSCRRGASSPPSSPARSRRRASCRATPAR